MGAVDPVVRPVAVQPWRQRMTHRQAHQACEGAPSRSTTSWRPPPCRAARGPARQAAGARPEVACPRWPHVLPPPLRSGPAVDPGGSSARACYRSRFAAPRPGRLRRAILGKLIYRVGKDPQNATRHDWFFAVALAVRNRLAGRLDDHHAHRLRRRPQAGLLSQPRIPDRPPARRLSLRNLGLYETASQALAALGVEADEVLKVEPDAALGNGGLGRLAACLLDSMATLGIAAHGYGIRYQHGLFKQGLDDGWQVERPEDWLAFGNLGVRALRGGLPGAAVRPRARGAQCRRPAGA